MVYAAVEVANGHQNVNNSNTVAVQKKQQTETPSSTDDSDSSDSDNTNHDTDDDDEYMDSSEAIQAVVSPESISTRRQSSPSSDPSKPVDRKNKKKKSLECLTQIRQEEVDQHSAYYSLLS